MTESQLFQSVREVVLKSRERVFRMINSSLLETYWQIGKLIVDVEQDGASKATYGKGILKKLSNELTLEFGKGFDARNLNNMRAFYISFPIWNALRTNLSWTHYRLLSYSVLNDKNKLFASKYLLYLPKEEELKELIDQDRMRFDHLEK